MASEDGLRERVGRKLTKRPKEPRRVSLDVPDTLKDGQDVNEDASAAPRGREIWSMNQSLFSMIARTSSQADLHTRLDQIASSESEDEPTAGGEKTQRITSPGRRTAAGFASRHRRRISDHKLLKSLPRLRSRKSDRDPSTDAHMSASQILPSRPAPDTQAETIHRATSVSNKGSKETDESEESRTGSLSRLGRRSRQGTASDSPRPQDKTLLEKRLKEIFQFDEVESLLAGLKISSSLLVWVLTFSESNCWLVQSVLLQGYLYITQKHICFYAYLAKKEPGKSGFLAKRGNSKYNRYWFVLKGDVLAYYNDPTDLYYPRNRISLTHASSASIIEPKAGQEATGFKIETDNRTFKFKADSSTSALDWVRAIQKVIFRSHNDGSSVKISIPLQNVWDIEEMTLMDFAQTVKIRVIDNDETFVMDEVCSPSMLRSIRWSVR